MSFETAGAVFVALLGVGAFAVVVVRSRIVSFAKALTLTASAGVGAMLDPDLNDRDKELAIRRAGLALILGGWNIFWRLGLAVAAMLVPILLADLAAILPKAASLGVLLRLDFIVLVSVLAVVVLWLAHRSKRNSRDAERAVGGETADAADRMIHALAFSGPRTLSVSAKLDDRLFAGRIEAVPWVPPVFITSLARGGTTALLNALHGHPGLATHLYADMPFLGAPLLWSKLRRSKRTVIERERAHGDGMQIGLDSPEAFDEVFWHHFWPEKYSDDAIALWRAEDEKPAATAFFKRHFRKIVSLRRPDSGEAARYLSKNNANIARLDLLPKMFPGSAIIVPLRHPAAHAASLFRQHTRFLQIHASDPFALRYMRDIGHFEFGQLHRPLEFGSVVAGQLGPDHPDYWLGYWLDAMRVVSQHRDTVIFVTQDDLRSAPQQTLRALADKLGLSPVPNAQGHFRAEPDVPPRGRFDADLLAEAEALYHQLAGEALR